MDERLDRISASAFKTIFRFAVQSAAHQRSGLASRSVMRPPRYRHCDVDSPDSFKQLRLSVAAGAHGKGMQSRRVVSPRSHDAL